ncbi:MAG: hypothetical protein IPK12_17790 [Gemmatimonadetes bacterium]|nr:hypothetical protein [Gemmatimonadota bacterium]
MADFTRFAQWLLPSFAEEDKAELLWRDFRNGLVHEARLKNGAQFELGRPTTLSYHGRMPVIDPERLVEEVHDALRRVAFEIRERSTTHHEVARLLAREFEFELSDVIGRGIGQEQSSGPRDRKADP